MCIPPELVEGTAATKALRQELVWQVLAVDRGRLVTVEMD